MLTAQDVSYDEARNLHTKWQKHQAFMAELAANKDWLDKVDKVTSVGRATQCLSLWWCFWADPGHSIGRGGLTPGHALSRGSHCQMGSYGLRMKFCQTELHENTVDERACCGLGSMS
jgi:hypothetical protein